MPLVPDFPAKLRRDPSRELRVLIIDDQPIVRGALRSGLETIARSFTVIEAENGAEALAIMQRVPIDIVYADIVLPELSGPEALALAFPEHQKRPFMVLISGSREIQAIGEIGRRLGAYEFLSKPFRVIDIQRTVASFERLEAGLQVLLVDDSQTARRLMTRILDRSRFAIHLAEAGSGSEAIRQARGTVFDVIFCDLNMPDMSGLEAAQALLRMNAESKIVVVSTVTEGPTIDEARQAGVFAFLQKPFDHENVDAILHEALSMARPSLVRPGHARIYGSSGVHSA
jgi:CheY-like chemotaxis protein